MTTDEMRNQVIELSDELRIAKERLAKRLLKEFPAREGDIIIHPRNGEYRIGRVSPRYDGVVLYLHKKTVKGYDIRETTLSGIEDGILSGVVRIANKAAFTVEELAGKEKL